MKSELSGGTASMYAFKDERTNSDSNPLLFNEMRAILHAKHTKFST